MQLNVEYRSITFKCDNVYWEAVKAGVKKAELRLLSRQEWSAVLDHPPEEIWLTDLKSGISLFRRITWFAAVGEVCGFTYVMFCFEDADL